MSGESFCIHVIRGKLRHAGAVVGVRKKYDFETLAGLEVGITAAL